MTKSKIAKNTILLYIRMIIVMIVNLFTVRLLYLALGNSDYGIFNVIFGFVVIFQSVSSVLATSAQRFFAFSLGRNELKEISKIYTASVNIYLLLSLTIFIIAETFGLWFINAHLNLPANSITHANILYQFSIITFIFTVFQSQFISVILAHEDINIYAIITLCEAILKLTGTSVLLLFSTNRLDIYGLILLAIASVSLLVYYIVVKKKYPTCKYKQHHDKPLYKNLLSFSGWHLFSSIASVGMLQINTILVNIFFGIIANAARAIALQINSAIISFTSSFITALRPPMIKAYAAKNYVKLNQLFDISNKTIFYLLLIILLPAYLTMDTLLTIWLDHVDNMTVQFSKLTVIYAFILSLNNPISIIVQASGKVKLYFSIVEIFTLLCPLLTYFAYKYGAPVQATFYIMIAAISSSHIARIYCLKKIYPLFQLKSYLFSFLLRGLTVCILAFLILEYTLHSNINLIVFYLLSFSISTTLIYIIGLSKSDKFLIKTFVLNKICTNG